MLGLCIFTVVRKKIGKSPSLCNHWTCMKIKVLTAQKIDSARHNNVEARGSADRNIKIIQWL